MKAGLFMLRALASKILPSCCVNFASLVTRANLKNAELCGFNMVKARFSYFTEKRAFLMQILFLAYPSFQFLMHQRPNE